MFTLLFTLFISYKVEAFSDLVRHGYTSCRACHVSPNGGGVLNAYGRSISKELLSTWSYEGEEEVLHGALPKQWVDKYKEKFFIGGDVRGVQTHVDNEQRTAGEFFLMQAQVHVGAKFDKIEAVTTLGKIENPRESEKVELKATEYYANLLLSDESILRIGKFNPSYGIFLQDHNLWIKSQLGLMPWLERDTVELSFINQSVSVFVSGFQSTTSNPAIYQTTGNSTNMSLNISDNQQVGFSYKTEEGKLTKNQTYGLWTKLSPLGAKSYMMAELDRVKTTASVQTIGFLRTGYEVTKGVTPLLQLQHQAKEHPTKENNWRYGIGMQFLPRPHWEIFMMLEEVKLETSDATEGFIVFHYYL